MNLSALLVTLLVTYALPAITAFFTKVDASAFWKQFVTALLSAATGLIVAGTVADGTALISKEAALLALGAFVLAQANYLGLYKPHNANALPIFRPGSGIG